MDDEIRLNVCLLSLLLLVVSAEVEDHLVKLGSDLYQEDIKDAHIKSALILGKVQKFNQYVDREIAAAKEAMRCCYVEHETVRTGLHWMTYLVIVVLGVMTYFAIMNCMPSSRHMKRY